MAAYDIKPQHELHLASRVEFDNARVHAKQANITLEKTTGSVEISDSGVSGEGLQAELSGVPIRLSITRRQRDTLVSSSLMVPEKLLAQLAGRELPVSGSARWRLELAIPDYAASDRDRLEAALAAGDRTELRKVVHTIKPQFRMLGMEQMAGLAQEIEDNAVEGTDLDRLPAQVENLLADIRTSVQTFETYLEQI